MGTESPTLEHAALIDDVLHALDEADGTSWREKAMRAATFLKHAVARGAHATAQYWKEKYKSALAQGKKHAADKPGAAEPEKPAPEKAAADDDGPEITIEPVDDDDKKKDGEQEPEGEKPAASEPEAEPEKKPEGAPEGEKPADGVVPDGEKPADGAEQPADGEAPAAKGDKKKRRKRRKKKDAAAEPDGEKPEGEPEGEKSAEGEEEIPADEKTVDPDAEDVDVEGLSEEEAALVQNKKHRTRKGKEAAEEVGEKRGGVLSSLGDMLGGIAGAVGAVGNWVAGGLSSLDAKTLGKAAGSLVFAALGGLAFGGVGALAGMALAQYFGSKASSSNEESVKADVYRAFALAEKKDGAKAGQAQWANHVLDAVQTGFENLGEMDSKELAAVLKAAKRFKKDLLPGAKKDV